MCRKYTVTLLEPVVVHYSYDRHESFTTLKVSVKSHTEIDGIAKFGYAPHGCKVDHSHAEDQYMYLVPDTEIDTAFIGYDLTPWISTWEVGKSYEVGGFLSFKAGHELYIEDKW